MGIALYLAGVHSTRQRDMTALVMISMMMMRFVEARNCGCRAFNGELQAASKRVFRAYKQGRPG